jgi:glycosyltransferase involved in cell wall biosynthesis
VDEPSQDGTARPDGAAKTCVSLYICNWSLNDPLCQSQTLPYLRALAEQGYPSCLITCERPSRAGGEATSEPAAHRLAADGIRWIPVRYHDGASLLHAGGDFIRLFASASAAVARHRPRIVHTRTSVPGAVGMVLSAAARLPFLYDADSELSEEYVDGGHWKRGSLRHRLLSWVEATSRRRADALVVLTDRLRAHFADRGVTAPMTVIPCCVDADRFRFDAAARSERRRQLKIGDDKLLVYVGKTGPRYLVDETMLFAKAAAQADGVRFLVLSSEPASAFEAIAERCGFDRSLLSVFHAAPADVPGWLSAADAGMALIRETPSERGSSPIKISEYLVAGLPVVMTPSIGDMSDAVERGSLGVVLEHQSAAARAMAASRLRELWTRADAVRQRCMAWARASVDLHAVGVPRYRQVYDRLLESNAAYRTVRMAGRPEGA